MDRYIRLFINSIEKGEIKEALTILEEIPDDVLRREIAEYSYRRILFRGRVLTSTYTERHVQTLIRNNNLIYHIINSKNVDLIQAFIERLSDTVDYEDEFSTDMFREDLISIVLSSLMYGIASEELFEAIFNIFEHDIFRLFGEIYEMISDEFVGARRFIKNYFTIGRLKRLFDRLNLDDDDYIKIFKVIQRITGISMEEYIHYIETASELNFLPEGIKRLIGDFITKD